MIAGQLLSLAIVWAAAGWKGARAETLRLMPPQTDWLTAVGYGLLLIVLIGPIELLLYHLAGVPLFTDGRWILDGLSSPYWLAVVVAAVVLAPLWEETAFRGFLLSALAKSRMGFWPAALISVVLWTVLHLGYSWPGLVSVFTNDPDVVRTAARLIMIAAVAQPFIGTTEIYTGALRGAGDTRSPLFITAIGAWSVRVPVTVLAIRVLGMPIAAAWWAMVSEWVVRAVLVTAVFRRGRWQQLRL